MTFSTQYRLRDRDRGINRVLQLVGLSASVSVGILGSKASEVVRPRKGSKTTSKATVGEIATYLELGTPTQLPRPVIGAWFDKNIRQNRAFQREIAKQRVLGRMTQERALMLMGARSVGGMQKMIAAGVTPPNAESTKKRKGSSKPWIDTGQTRSSFSYRLNKGK